MVFVWDFYRKMIFHNIQIIFVIPLGECGVNVEVYLNCLSYYNGLNYLVFYIIHVIILIYFYDCVLYTVESSYNPQILFTFA